MPMLNLGISKLYDKLVNPIIKDHESKTLEEYYERKRKLERKRLESTDFVKQDLEIEKEKITSEAKEKNISLTEKENKLQEEKITLEERENIANKEKIELVERENIANKEKIQLDKKEDLIQKQNKELAKKEYMDIQHKKELILLEFQKIQKDYIEIENKNKTNKKQLYDIEQKISVLKAHTATLEKENKLQEEKNQKIKEEMQLYEDIARNINEEQSRIIQIIAGYKGKAYYEDLQRATMHDEVKLDDLLEDMENKKYIKRTQIINGVRNVELITKGRKYAIEHNYVS